jgi:hypothetical protein
MTPTGGQTRQTPTQFIIRPSRRRMNGQGTYSRRRFLLSHRQTSNVTRRRMTLASLSTALSTSPASRPRCVLCPPRSIISQHTLQYITWLAQGVRVWSFTSDAIVKNDKTQIGARPIPQEPMYLIANLGISEGFGAISPELTFPTVMRIDYIRVYQPKDQINVGCDPADFPTKAYIERYVLAVSYGAWMCSLTSNRYKEAYSNPNLTTWVDDYHQKIPKNKLVDQC